MDRLDISYRTGCKIRLSRSESRYVAIAQRSRSLHKYVSWRQVNAHKQRELCSCMRTVHARSAFPADNVDNVKVKLLPTGSYRSHISPLLEIMRARSSYLLSADFNFLVVSTAVHYFLTLFSQQKGNTMLWSQNIDELVFGSHTGMSSLVYFCLPFVWHQPFFKSCWSFFFLICHHLVKDSNLPESRS